MTADWHMWIHSIGPEVLVAFADYIEAGLLPTAAEIMALTGTKLRNAYNILAEIREIKGLKAANEGPRPAETGTGRTVSGSGPGGGGMNRLTTILLIIIALWFIAPGLVRLGISQAPEQYRAPITVALDNTKGQLTTIWKLGSPLLGKYKEGE